MKKTLLFLSLGALMFITCKKAASPVQIISYENFTRNDILALENHFTADWIPYNDPAKRYFEIGSTILFKTNLSNYGKIKIKDIYTEEDGIPYVKLDFITFQENGDVSVSQSNIIIEQSGGTQGLDLDTGSIKVDNSVDFVWVSSSATYYIAHFEGNTLFYLYKQ